MKRWHTLTFFGTGVVHFGEFLIILAPPTDEMTTVVPSDEPRAGKAARGEALLWLVGGEEAAALAEKLFVEAGGAEVHILAQDKLICKHL